MVPPFSEKHSFSQPDNKISGLGNERLFVLPTFRQKSSKAIFDSQLLAFTPTKASLEPFSVYFPSHRILLE